MNMYHGYVLEALIKVLFLTSFFTRERLVSFSQQFLLPTIRHLAHPHIPRLGGLLYNTSRRSVAAHRPSPFSYFIFPREICKLVQFLVSVVVFECWIGISRSTCVWKKGASVNVEDATVLVKQAYRSHVTFTHACTWMQHLLYVSFREKDVRVGGAILQARSSSLKKEADPEGALLFTYTT